MSRASESRATALGSRGSALPSHSHLAKSSDLQRRDAGWIHCIAKVSNHESTRGHGQTVQNLLQDGLFDHIPIERVGVDEALQAFHREPGEVLFRKRIAEAFMPVTNTRL